MDTLKQAYAKTIQDELQPLKRRQNEIRLEALRLQDSLTIAKQTRTTAVSLLAQPRDEKPGGKHATRDAGELDIVIAEGDRIALIEKQLEVMEQVRRLLGRQIEQRKQYAGVLVSIRDVRKKLDRLAHMMRSNTNQQAFEGRLVNLGGYMGDIEDHCSDLVAGLSQYGIDCTGLQAAISDYIDNMHREFADLTGEDYDTGTSTERRSGESSGIGSEATAA